MVAVILFLAGVLILLVLLMVGMWLCYKDAAEYLPEWDNDVIVKYDYKEEEKK